MRILLEGNFKSKSPAGWAGEGERQSNKAVPTSFSRERGELTKAGGLTCSEELTVAEQRRTCTGFAIEPSHPGEKAP